MGRGLPTLAPWVQLPAVDPWSIARGSGDAECCMIRSRWFETGVLRIAARVGDVLRVGVQGRSIETPGWKEDARSQDRTTTGEREPQTRPCGIAQRGSRNAPSPSREPARRKVLKCCRKVPRSARLNRRPRRRPRPHGPLLLPPRIAAALGPCARTSRGSARPHVAQSACRSR